MTLPYSCGGCTVRWSGYRTAHCSVCHLTFAGPSGFDTHRYNGACRNPADIGMAATDRPGYTVWGDTMDDAGRERLERLRHG